MPMVRIGPDGRRQLAMVRWGLVPHWATDVSIGNRLINARAETIGSKPAFRDAVRRRRCLVPADGFYEWQRMGRRRQPFFMNLRGDEPFAFAGLWEHWQRDDRCVDSCTIITTEANDLIRPIHDRMPVILHPADYALWLDPSIRQAERVEPLLCPYPAEEMTARPVDSYVNVATHEGPACLQGQRDLFADEPPSSAP